MISIRETEEGVIFSVQVLPKSSKPAVAGIHNDALKVKVAAPPVEGRGNEACLEVLAEWLGVRASRISILSGHHSRKNSRRSGAEKERY